MIPSLVFDEVELKLLELYFKGQDQPITLQDYIQRLAKLGGYLARANDLSPGNTVIWRGLNKL